MTVTPTERPAWAASVVKFSRRPGVWPAASLALVAVLVLTSATTSLARPAGTFLQLDPALSPARSEPTGADRRIHLYQHL